MNRLLLGLLLGACAASAHAGPSINIGTFYDYLEGNKSSYLKRVHNTGESTAFVRVNIHEITFAEDGTPTESPLDNNGAGAAVRQGLIASPARLIVPSQGMQATRLLYIGNRDRERYYRVRFTPVVPEREDQFAVSEEDRAAYAQSMSAGVNVMTGYGAVFFVQPKEVRFDTQIADGPKDYRVLNAGNATIELDEFKNCAASAASDCEPTRKHILRPGKAFVFDKAGRAVTFDLVEGGKKRAMVVKS
ncbi:molecular chaperone [Pseudomonas sp. HR96]|uniref:molecular chaperone n=1 Tax=Pseudomonas sp. HR96 TaxID=1027966 RepID=UPI002A762B3A|nr:molecular chaperone [Pseudomonas sp. HR96]WPO98210.1 molecular chaperone [Pseudomonas sp. HR96]